MKIEKAAVIGGGIGGLAVAIFLSRMGCEVTVYERASKPGPVGAGFLLQPPGIAVLQQLGVLQNVMKYAVPIVRLHSETSSGHQLMDLRYSDLDRPESHGLGIQRRTIYDALYEKALGEDLIHFEWDREVERCEPKESQSNVIVDEQSISYDLCVISAGANSHLSEGLFKGRTSKPYEWGCIWSSIKLPSGFSMNTLHQRCHRSSKMMGVLPVHQGQDRIDAALYWSARVEEMRHLQVGEYPGVINEISEFWPEVGDSLRELEGTDLVSAIYRDVWTPKPFLGSTVAIADISHATSPQLGQGCTMALLDAWLLVKTLDGNECPMNESFEMWWKSRKYQLIYLRHLSKVLTPLYQSDSAINAFLRDRVVAPLGRIPWLYKLQLKTLASQVFLKDCV